MLKLVNNLEKYFLENPKVGKVKINSNLSIEKVAERNFKYIESWKRLEGIVGEKRFSRTLERAGIKIKKKPSMTKKSIRKFFIYLMNIQKADVDELKGTIDEKIQKLFPFKSFEKFKKIFLGKSLNDKNFFYDTNKFCGKGLRGIKEKVYLSTKHHFQVLNESKDEPKRFIRDNEFLSSRFADREYEEGSVVHLSDGYYYVAKNFIGGGAYVYLLRGLKDENRVKIVCRGSALHPFAIGVILSIINDFALEIGSLGVKGIFQDLLQYLEDEGIDEIECIVGKSLGGSIAQILTTFIKGLKKGIKIKNLVTMGSPGVSNGVNKIAEKVLGSETKIHVIRNGGGKKYHIDCIPLLGGKHLGEGDNKNTTIYYVKPGEGDIESYPEKLNFISRIYKFFLSFVKAHLRQTTLKEFSIRKIEKKEDVDKEIKRGNMFFEIVRKIIAYILGVISFWIFNGISLATYYRNLPGKIEENRRKVAEMFA